MKKKMFVSFGVRDLFPEARKHVLERFFIQLRDLFGTQYDIEECVPVQLTHGRYVWSANSHPDPADVLVVVLFDRPAHPIEFIVRRREQEGMKPIPVVILGGFFYHPFCARPDYTNVSVSMNLGGPYEYCDWVCSSWDDGLIKINDFLMGNKLPFSD